MKGLPNQYDPMILGLEVSGIMLMVDIVKAKILEDVKITSESKSGGEAFLSKSKSTPKSRGDKSSLKCYRCKKPGHYASQCPSQVTEKNKEKKSKNSGHAAFFAAYNAGQMSHTMQEDWIFDSGATAHLCRNRDLLLDTQNVSSSINVANNAVVPVVAKGLVKVLADTGVATCEVTMDNVLCVPNIAVNLLSVSRVCQKGYSVTFTKEACKVVSPENEVVAIGQMTNGLYKLQRANGLSAMVCKAEDNYQLWHRRLCHMSVGCMKRLGGMASGFEFNVADSTQCIPCIQGKHQRQPFHFIGRREERVLELVHSDLCGPMETASIGGSRYFLTFIDDASRKAFVYFLKSKTEVLDAFEDFKSFAENLTGETIKRLRTDNGKEYVNRQMRQFLRRFGIQHEKSVPYNPEQNGLAERMNRTIVKKSRSMLHDAHLQTSAIGLKQWQQHRT